MSKNNVKHSRTKHIDTKYHYIREVYTKNYIDILHIPAAEQAADVLTKPLRSSNKSKRSNCSTFAKVVDAPKGILDMNLTEGLLSNNLVELQGYFLAGAPDPKTQFNLAGE